MCQHCAGYGYEDTTNLWSLTSAGPSIPDNPVCPSLCPRSPHSPAPILFTNFANLPHTHSDRLLFFTEIKPRDEWFQFPTSYWQTLISIPSLLDNQGKMPSPVQANLSTCPQIAPLPPPLRPWFIKPFPSLQPLPLSTGSSSRVNNPRKSLPLKEGREKGREHWAKKRRREGGQEKANQRKNSSNA